MRTRITVKTVRQWPVDCHMIARHVFIRAHVHSRKFECIIRLLIYCVLSCCVTVFVSLIHNKQHLQCDCWCWSSWGHLSVSKWPTHLCHLYYSVWDWSIICESTKHRIIQWYQCQQCDSSTQCNTPDWHSLLLYCVFNGSTNAGHLSFRYESLFVL